MTEPQEDQAESHGSTPALHAELPDVPDYTCISLIGRGGFGSVYLAYDVTGIPFALKVVKSSDLGDNYKYEREYASIRAHRPISGLHPHLLQILHVGMGDGFFYYTMPLADSKEDGPFDPDAYQPKSLAEAIRSHGGAMSVTCAIRTLIPVLDALCFLHEHGLVHRDIKPDNIVYLHGNPVLGDIGLITEPKPNMSIVISRGFSPPDGVTDTSGDLYAFGKTLFAAVGGDVLKVGLPVPTILCEQPSDLFPALNKIICKACKLKYASATAMKVDLAKILRKASKLGRVSKVPRATSHSPIDIKYAEIGGHECFLGVPTHNEQACTDGAGRYRTYKHRSGMLSSIHWHPDVGAFETRGGIRSEWEKRDGERSFLGYPVSDEDGFTDADYLRDIMGKPAESLPEVPRMIGRRSLFQGGCIVWLHDPDIRSKCGEFAVFCRPLAGGDGWRIVVKDKPSKSFWDSIMEPITGKSDSARPSTILEKQLDPGYAANAWAAYQKAAADKTQPKTEPAKEDEPAEEPTASAENPQGPDTASPAQPTTVDLVHQSDHLLAGTGPIWDLQGGPGEFAWEGRGGWLYKMTAPYTFIEGQTELNETALAKVRVAIFLPPDSGPNTPMVYTLADTGEDFSSNSCMVPTVLDSGYGMVAIDTPMTGICKFGADMDNGLPSNIDNDFAAAVRNIENKCGAQNMGGPFTYHLQRVTARNLWLTQRFLAKDFGIRPRKTVLTGVGFGAQTAAFAFNATGFSDVLLAFVGIPELLGIPKENPIKPAGSIAETSGKRAFSMTSLLGGLIFETVPEALDAIQGLFKTIPPADDYWRNRLNPAHYADTVKHPREIHLLCGNSDQVFSQKTVKSALKRYKRLTESGTLNLPLAEAGRNSWPYALKSALSHGKSVVWFDGGHDLSGWRGDLRRKFLEIKLRMLNGGT